MSEFADCPYCGSKVRTEKSVDYDNKIKLRCMNCGGLFEYMPGFGSFSLPDQEQRKQDSSSFRFEGARDITEPGVYQDEVPWTVERPRSEASDCGKCCAIGCILCFILPVISWIIVIFSLFDLIF